MYLSWSYFSVRTVPVLLMNYFWRVVLFKKPDLNGINCTWWGEAASKFHQLTNYQASSQVGRSFCRQYISYWGVNNFGGQYHEMTTAKSMVSKTFSKPSFRFDLLQRQSWRLLSWICSKEWSNFGIYGVQCLISTQPISREKYFFQ